MKSYRPGLLILALAGGLLTATAALAGLRMSDPVTIDDGKSSAKGDLGAVRNTTDTVQEIGCIMESATMAFCYATNSAGVSRSCTTSDPNLVANVRGLNGDSRLFFHWDTTGACTFIGTETASWTDPKH